jgi:hypothetical protein
MHGTQIDATTQPITLTPKVRYRFQDQSLLVFRWGPASLPALSMTGTEAGRHQQRSPDSDR